MLRDQITWHFGPPLASHQNGFTEAFFRLVRKIFRSVVGEATLDEFDLLTLVTEIERILNDRPITHLPSTPDDLDALTPSMILTGSLGDAVVPGVFMKGDVYRRSWRKTKYLADLVWDRWLKEYLPLLQPRQKWFGAHRNLQPGDLLVMEESAKRGNWPKGIVEAVMPDSNNLVRRVKSALLSLRWFEISESCVSLNPLLLKMDINGLLNNNYGLFEHNKLSCCIDQLHSGAPTRCTSQLHECVYINIYILFFSELGVI